MMLSSISGRIRPGVGVARVIPILLGCGLLATIPSITPSAQRKILQAQQSPHGAKAWTKENVLLARKVERLLTP